MFDAEGGAFLHALWHRRQSDATATWAMPGVTFHTGYHRANHGKVYLVVEPVQHLIGIRQRGLAMGTGCCFCRDCLVGFASQRATAALAAQAALARSDTPRLFRLVRLLPLRWRQAGIVGSLRRIAESRFKSLNPRRQGPHLRPKREDQGVLFSVAQVVEVRKLAHASV